MPGTVASQLFVQDVRWALRHLYDLAELRKSPLLQVLNIVDHEDPLSDLHAIITDAIQALAPGASAPPQAHTWRVYHILYQRYVEQFTQKQVAIDLATSIRQLRRQEDLAVEVLANYLWSRYDLQRTAGASTALPPARGTAAPSGPPPSREQELDWLKRTLPSEATHMGAAIQSVLQTVAPMTSALGVSIECAASDNLPRAALPPTTLRQALLNVLTAAIRSAPHERVQIRTRADRTTIRLSISAMSANSVSQAHAQAAESLDMARQLVELSGGSLRVETHPAENVLFTAELILPAIRSIEALVIDDNLDTIHLFQDYLAGTRYHFTGTPDPEEALQWIGERPFQVVILDVMLPGIDGWELLGRLREHPATHDVPIVVCTIMPQEELALTLGAAAFQRKPVSRAALLATLDALMSPPA